MTNPETAAVVEALTRKLIDEGRIIEAGWRSFDLMVLPPTAPQVQRDEMRKAFFAGAQHLFASLVTAMDDGPETPDEMRRVELIDAELAGFAAELRREMARWPR